MGISVYLATLASKDYKFDLIFHTLIHVLVTTMGSMSQLIIGETEPWHFGSEPFHLPNVLKHFCCHLDNFSELNLFSLLNVFCFYMTSMFMQVSSLHK